MKTSCARSSEGRSNDVQGRYNGKQSTTYRFWIVRRFCEDRQQRVVSAGIQVSERPEVGATILKKLMDAHTEIRVTRSTNANFLN